MELTNKELVEKTTIEMVNFLNDFVPDEKLPEMRRLIANMKAAANNEGWSTGWDKGWDSGKQAIQTTMKHALGIE